MLRKYFLISGTMLLMYGAHAQNVGINSTGASPHASAMLDVVSTTSGILIPRMTAAQRTAIASPATGLLVYQTNASAPIPADQFWFYDGTAWRPLFSDRIGWSIWGNTGTTPGTNFLGTTDNVGLRIKTNNADRFEFTNNGRIRSYDNGTAGQPTYSWYGASGGENTGIYRPAASVLGFSTGGNERFRIPNGFQVHAMSNGTAAAPFYSWSSNAGTGMFQQAANVIGLSTNGTERFRIPNANQVHAVQDGTAALPFYSWAANTGMGIFRATTNQLAFSTASAERMRITAAGQLLINRTTPTDPNLVEATVTTASYWTINGYNTGTGGGSGFFHNTNAGNGYNGTECITAGGNAGVWGWNQAAGTGVRGTVVNVALGWAGYFQGDVGCTGTYIGSDRRFKKDIRKLEGGEAVTSIMHLNPTSYHYRADEFPGMGFNPDKTAFGFIGQELEKVFPNLVAKKPIPDPTQAPTARQQANNVDGYYTVDYVGLIPVLTAAIQEQQRTIEELTKRIEQLEKDR